MSQCRFGASWVQANIACTYDVKRFARRLCESFCCEGFANARRTFAAIQYLGIQCETDLAYRGVGQPDRTLSQQ